MTRRVAGPGMFMIHDRERDLLAFFEADPRPDGFTGGVLAGAYLEPGGAGGKVVGVASEVARYRVFRTEGECAAAGYKPVASRAVRFGALADYVAWLAWLEEPAPVLRNPPPLRPLGG
jgi:hypothetical protein